MSESSPRIDRASVISNVRLAMILSIPLVIGCCQSIHASDPTSEAAPKPKTASDRSVETEPGELADLNKNVADALADKRYLSALRHGEQAYKLSLETAGERDPETLLSAHRLSEIYRFVGRDDDAETLLQETLKLRREVLGERDPETLKTLYNLAVLYRDRDRHEQAEAHFRETLQLTHDLYGDDQKPTQIVLGELVDLYRDTGRERDAEPLLRRLLEAQRRTLGAEHKDARESLWDLAWLNNDLHRYGQATTHFSELLNLERDILGDRHADTLATMHELGIAYWRQGQNGEAEILLREVLDTRREVLGRRHPDTLTSAHDLALIYGAQGLLDQARPLYEDTLAIKRATLGDDDPQTLITINNLANLYRDQGDYLKAEGMLEEAVRRYKRLRGEDHPDTLLAMNSLGSLYRHRGRYGQAGDIYEEVLERRRNVLGERHPQTLSSLHNLAHIYVRHTRYADAFPLYEQAYALRRDVLGRRHPDTLASEFGSVYALMYTDRVDEAVARLQETSDDRLAYAEAELASTRGPNARAALLDRQGYFQSYVLSLAIRHKRPDTLKLAGEVMLHWKQILRSEAAYIEHLVRTSDDPDVEALGQEILDLRARLARASQEEDPSENPVAVLEELDAKELALIRISGAFKRRQEVRRASIDQLQAVLPDNSGVVEFRQFEPLNDQGGSLGAPRFAALLVRPGQPPILGNAGEVEDVERLLAVIRNDIVPARAEKAATDLRKQLFSAFGDDFEALEKVYIAPDGILNLVPFERLRLADGRYWDELHDLTILQAGRDLLERVNPSNAAKGLLALGGIDFSSGASPAAKSEPSDGGSQAQEQLFASVDRSLLGEVRERLRNEVEVFNPLAGSLIEVQHIERLFRERRPEMPITVWTGHDASESRLKALDDLESPPRILHIATHGFYLANASQRIRSQLHSGVALAGANHGLAGGDVEGEDGVLYSLEAEGLDLEGTELVVLSACDTGNGVIDYSEGVVGMVRALRIAGARQVLMTLWPISDSATAEFMRLFYDHWLAKPDLGPAAALKATKTAFRNHPEQRYRQPRIWAPFVLIGA
jgi:tetratricopeptide (TPR) repeat protein